MYNYILDNGLRSNIWVNEVPMVNDADLDAILSEKDTVRKTGKKRIIIELFIPRDHNNYALLGLEFVPNAEQSLTYKISINNKEGTEYNNSIALSYDQVTWGILDEYKQGIINSMNKYLNNKSLTNGIINYNISAHAEMGSSQLMFEKVSDILLSLLVKENIDENIALYTLKSCLNIK